MNNNPQQDPPVIPLDEQAFLQYNEESMMDEEYNRNAVELKELELKDEREKRDLEIYQHLYTALAKCQGEMGAASKDRVNPHYKSAYSTLASIQDAIQQPLADNGLCFFHTMGQSIEDRTLTVTANIAHTKGGTIECSMTTQLPDLSPQKVGSAETYLRRYTLLAILGIATEDDDGEAAQRSDDSSRSNHSRPTTTAPVKPAVPAAPAHDGDKPDNWEVPNWQCYQAMREAFADEEIKPSVKSINKAHGINTWSDYRGLSSDTTLTINGELQAARDALEGAMNETAGG